MPGKRHGHQDAATAAPASITAEPAAPAHGDTVTFAYDTGGAPGPWFIQVHAYQEGALVYSASLPTVPGPTAGLQSPAGVSEPLQLTSVAWETGAAEAVAKLSQTVDGEYVEPALAEIAFPVT